MQDSASDSHRVFWTELSSNSEDRDSHEETTTTTPIYRQMCASKSVIPVIKEESIQPEMKELNLKRSGCEVDEVDDLISTEDIWMRPERETLIDERKVIKEVMWYL